MYIDAQNLFSDAQALTGSAASSNVIDLGVDGNLGIGEPMVVVVSLDAAADDANGDETYQFDLEFDDNGSFTSASVVASRTFARGSAAGEKFVLAVPADQSGERYLRLSYTLGGTTPSVTVTAFLIPHNMVHNYVQYADGFTIS